MMTIAKSAEKNSAERISMYCSQVVVPNTRAHSERKKTPPCPARSCLRASMQNRSLGRPGFVRTRIDGRTAGSAALLPEATPLCCLQRWCDAHYAGRGSDLQHAARTRRHRSMADVCRGAESSTLEIGIRLMNFLTGIHDERAVPHDRLVQRLTSQHE
jgi:hypothetical protein